MFDTKTMVCWKIYGEYPEVLADVVERLTPKLINLREYELDVFIWKQEDLYIRYLCDYTIDPAMVKRSIYESLDEANAQTAIIEHKLEEHWFATDSK